MLKVTEEVGEVAGALARNNLENLAIEIGDVVVTLTILAMQNGLDLNECADAAYQKNIKQKRQNDKRRICKRNRFIVE